MFQVAPFADDIVRLLSGLWSEVGNEQLIKQSILTVLIRLVNGLKAEWVRFASICLPIIHGILEDEQDRMYFLEDILDLW